MLIPAENSSASVCCIVFETAGTQFVMASGSGLTSGSQSGIIVQAAPASALLLTGVPSSATAGSAFSATVTAADSYGNTDTLYRGTVTWSSSDPQAGLPASYTFTSSDAGTRPFSITF